ncbi:MAG: beta-1,6-N-acetylglucosaminyltransferase [Pseudomonadota bacterium]
MIGFVILAHADLHRTAALARYLSASGAAVAIHVDRNTSATAFEALSRDVAGVERVVLAPRHACEWGRFSLIDATLAGVEALFAAWPDTTHVTLLSGACLPIRPIGDLEALLNRFRGVDFIEAVDVKRDQWVEDGLSRERFTLFFPFSWKRHRWIFDRSVDWQRKWRVKRRMPKGLRPHLGSQWWTLSRETLLAILNDPALPRYKRFFRLVWIPDESFFQTLVHKHGTRRVGRSLMYVAFDPGGKPYVFHDDHREMLMHAKGYFARKIWPGADALYATFLDLDLAQKMPARRNDKPLKRAIWRARKIRGLGRPGLIAQHRYASHWHEPVHTKARPYFVFSCFDRLHPDFVDCVRATGGLEMHGYLFNRTGAEFANGQAEHGGNLTNNPKQRDYRPEQFLVSLVWARRYNLQGFMHDFLRRAEITEHIRRDPAAQVLALSDAWLLDLFHRAAGDPRREVAFAKRYRRNLGHYNWARSQWDAKFERYAVSLTGLLRDPEAASRALQRRMPPGTDLRAVWMRPVALPDGFGAFLARLEAAELDLPIDPALRRAVASAAPPPGLPKARLGHGIS